MGKSKLNWRPTQGQWFNLGTKTYWQAGGGTSPLPGPGPRADFVIGETIPTRENTGVIPGSILATDTRTTISGSTVEVIQNKIFPNKLSLVNAQNKTFKNCKFEGRTGSSELVLASDDLNRNLRFEDCTFEQPESLFPKGYVGTSGGKMGFRGHHVTLLRCKFVTVVDHFRPRRGTGGDAAFIMQGCFADDLLFLSPDLGQPNRQSHNDVMQDDQVNDQANVLIEGNWLASHLNPRCGQAALPPTYDANGVRTGGNLEYPSLNGNANVQFAKTGRKDNYVYNKNWMFGGSAIFNAGAGAGDGNRLDNLHITNNKFGRDMRLGPDWILIIGSANPIGTFSGNTYFDNGAPANIRKNG